MWGEPAIPRRGTSGHVPKHAIFSSRCMRASRSSMRRSSDRLGSRKGYLLIRAGYRSVAHPHSQWNFSRAKGSGHFPRMRRTVQRAQIGGELTRTARSHRNRASRVALVQSHATAVDCSRENRGKRSGKKPEKESCAGKHVTGRTVDGTRANSPGIFFPSTCLPAQSMLFPRWRNTHRKTKVVGKTELRGWCSQQK